MFWKKKKENRSTPIVSKVVKISSKPKYSCGSIDERMIVLRIVIEARAKVIDYIKSLKNHIPLSSTQKHNQISTITDLFEGLFSDFLDAPTLENGRKIEEFWFRAVPILSALELHV